jgi:DmsE family decaheme c-type cytochrome
MARGRSLPLAAAVLASLALAALVLAQAPEPTPTPTPAPAAPEPASKPQASAAEAPPKCGDCHTEEVAKFGGNPHARYSHKDKKPDLNDFCETCHGNGAKHMEAGGDKSLIQTFHGLEGSELCLSCHQKANEHASFDLGFHGNTNTVNCLSCHSIHNSYPKNEHLIAKAPGELCATCHLNQTASFRNKPYAHRLDRGGMTCLDCHNPHDRKGQTVALTRVGELPCLNCHAEKRGPFVFDHVTGSAGDCLSCHQSHGSTNPKMLTWARVDQLCLSCHSQTGAANTLGSQPPSFHDLRSPRYRNCTTCHTAVHGSNLSPQLLK